MAVSICVSLLSSLAVKTTAHGMLTYPQARTQGNLTLAGLSNAYGDENVGWWWFSQPMVIPGKPVLNEPEDRTYNVHVSNGAKDWSQRFPWRAPGTAPVRGSGCGVSGGAPVPVPNGGTQPHPDLYPYGMDGKDLPVGPAARWTLGGTAEVAFAMLANHGGGYSYRLCKSTNEITEECFQRTVLQFHGDTSWLHYSEAIPDRRTGKPLTFPRVPIRRRVVPAEQVYPKGSQWARNPVPSCLYCDQSICGGALPNLTEPVTGPDAFGFGGDKWWQQEKCAQQCSGYNLMRCPPGMTQFDEPASGISGYLGDAGLLIGSLSESLWGVSGIEGFSYSIVDEIEVPAGLEPGEYVLSWRWDAEQSPQIWQNCADVLVVPPSTVQV